MVRYNNTWNYYPHPTPWFLWTELICGDTEWSPCEDRSPSKKESGVGREWERNRERETKRQRDRERTDITYVSASICFLVQHPCPSNNLVVKQFLYLMNKIYSLSKISWCLSFILQPKGSSNTALKICPWGSVFYLWLDNSKMQHSRPPRRADLPTPHLAGVPFSTVGRLHPTDASGRTPSPEDDNTDLSSTCFNSSTLQFF